MFELEIFQPDRSSKRFSLAEGTYPVGRNENCRIRLRHPEVSERHALLLLHPGDCRVEDLGSSNGTQLNDAPVQNSARLAHNDRLTIGPYVLTLLDDEASTPPDIKSDAPAPEALNLTETEKTNADADTKSAPQPKTSLALSKPAPSPEHIVTTTPTDPFKTQRRQIKTQIHRELIQRLDLRRLTAARVNSQELQRRAKDTLKEILDDIRQRLPAGMDVDALGHEIYNEALRLGPLEDLLADESVTEIMVNGPHQVYVERDGRLEPTYQDFMDESSVLAIIERIVSPLGRRIDESQPYVDARLPDGSRVNAIISPLSLTGPCLTIRKFSKRPFTDADLVRFGTLSDELTFFLRVCVQMRKNIVVSGGTGSGKTSLLNVLSHYVPTTDRIVTIEDAAELRLGQPHLVRLEARPANIEGRGAITIRDLVRNALRMRPDRIIVGECRGGEALDMLQAMNTGHDGSLTTVHANSPRDVISRLETMVLMSGMELPSRAIREQIASAIDLVVHESRFSDGSRKVTCVSEVVGLEGAQITMQDIFVYRQTGIDENGRVRGGFTATGAMPTFFEELKARGMELDPAIFKPTMPRRETSV